jgi:hypothetical protein
MLKYLSDLFSSLLNMSVFMNDDSYKSNTSVEVEEKETEVEEKETEVEEKETEVEEKETEVEEKETEVEEKETGEIFEFIEINDDDVFDFFITKF